MWKAVLKDERNCHLMHLPDWCHHFVENLHVSPVGLVEQKGKHRLVFDGSFRPNPENTAIKRRWFGCKSIRSGAH